MKNWKLWIATPITLGLGLWFAHAVIPHTDRPIAPTCTEQTRRADRADFTDDTRPIAVSWLAPSCDRDAR